MILAGTGLPAAAQTAPTQFQLLEATVPQIREALRTRLMSSEELVNLYLRRIDAYDGLLNAYLTVNARAAQQAATLDKLRFRPGRQALPLDGVPVALKDIVDTRDMPTTGGAFAMAASTPPDDAFITRKLRQAGAVILGKATLTEFANFVTSGMPGGYSGVGGYGFNPYNPVVAPDGDGRPLLSPSGSSAGSGIAAAANLAALTIGTETSGSILSPSNANGIVGIKPTVGLVSRDGIIPITADQDTAGPMTRTVTDAAILLGVIAGHDEADPATAACLAPGRCLDDYTPFLQAGALQGARLAVPPSPDARAALMEGAIAQLRAAGATVEVVAALPGIDVPGILNYGQKRDLNAYLASLPASFPIRTLSDLIAYNASPPRPLTTAQTVKYGQSEFVASDALDLSPDSADTATYIAHRDAGLAGSRRIIANVLNGPDAVAGTADDFDAVLFSGSGGAVTWARAGYPTVIVPLGFVESDGVQIPSGLSFAGAAWSEGKLISLAYAFEQINRGRLPPSSAPALPTDTVLRGDVDGNHVVDAGDVALTRARLGERATGAYDKSDVDGNGVIGVRDLLELAKLCTVDRC